MGALFFVFLGVVLTSEMSQKCRIAMGTVQLLIPYDDLSNN